MVEMNTEKSKTGVSKEKKKKLIKSIKNIETINNSDSRSLTRDAWEQFTKHKLGMIGAIVVVLIVLFTVLGPVFYKTDPRTINFSISMDTPSFSLPFGADDMGHDLFARAIWGGQISISVGLVSMLLSIFIGTLIGSISGYFGGIADSLLMRFTDLCISLPRLPILMMVIFLFREKIRMLVGPETGIFILIVSMIGAFGWMTTARVVRASFISVKNQEFIEAAKCVGIHPSRIIIRHILPNVLSPIIVSATLGVATAIISESSLSFLGLGFPPDVPTWGRMLFDGRNYLTIAPHMAIVPGILIFLSVLSINFIGDGLRDAFDPRLRIK